MNHFDDFNQAGKHITGPVCLSIGVFDGVHLGHQEIIRQTDALAQRLDSDMLVISFFPHPLSILMPDKAPRDIMPRRRKIALLQHYGCGNLLMLQPTPELLRVRAERFMNEMIYSNLDVSGAVVGYDFAFGYKREGNIEFLTEHSRRNGYELEVVAPVKLEDEIISSTGIRKLLQNGHVKEAAQMLGRYPSLEGHVAHGEGRGKKLGFPTANLKLPPSLCAPRHGVYAVLARTLDRKLRPGVLHIGAKPTFAGREVLAEVNLFESPGDIYGKNLRAFLIEHIRTTRRFGNADELVRQMKIDADKAKKIIEKNFDLNKCI